MALILDGSNDTITGLQINSANIVNGSITADDLASGVGGKILQVLQSVKTDSLQEDIAAGAVSGDITGLTVSITPSNASNKILISISVSACFQDANELIAATIYKSGSAISGAIGDASGSKQRVSFPSESYWNDNMSVISGEYLDTAGGTSAITYSVRLSHGNSSTKAILINRVPGSMESDDAQHMRAISTITVMEVAA